MPNKKAKPVDRAQPTIKQATVTDAQKVTVARSTSASMAKSPLWGGAGDVQAAAKAWNQSADDLESNAKVIADLRNQLKTAEAKQQGIRRSYRACKRQVLSTVSLVCAGSADAVKGFSLEVITRATPSPLDVVEGLTTSPGSEMGEASAKWLKGRARNGFLVQHCTSPADPATCSGSIACTRTKYTLTGAGASGTSVYFRIAAVDPLSLTGQTPWTGWVAATVR